MASTSHFALDLAADLAVMCGRSADVDTAVPQHLPLPIGNRGARSIRADARPLPIATATAGRGTGERNPAPSLRQ